MNLYPSKAYQWGSPGGCPGSVKMQIRYPENKKSRIQKEGAYYHEFAKLVFDAIKLDRDASIESIIKSVSEKLKNCEGVVDVDRDLFSHFKQTLTAETFIYSEIKLPIRYIHESMFGVIDLLTLSKDKIEITDLKFGFKKVEAFENWQLICYAAGVLENFSLIDHVKVVLKISQPRINFTDRWVTNFKELTPYFKILKEKATEAIKSDPSVIPGKHCLYCSAISQCHAAFEYGMGIFELSQKMNSPAILTNQQLGFRYRIVELAAQYLSLLESGIREEVKNRLRGGQLIPDYYAKQKTGNLKWVCDTDQVKQIGDLFNVVVKKEIIKTPAQVIKDGVPEEIIKLFSKRGRAGFEPVFDDGKLARSKFNGD